MTETLAQRIKDLARQIRWQGGGDDDTTRGATFSILYDIGMEVAALTAERDALREALRPFARVGELIKPLQHIAATDTYLWKQDSTKPTGQFGITLADCIEARRVLGE